ncbi:MAG: hypothetical protein U0746_09615 [Gemmataceae bacterium]
MSPMWLPVVIGIVALVAVFVAANYYAEKKRREALTAVAAELGFTYEAKSKGEFLGPAADFEVFKVGRSRRYVNVLSGTTAALQATVFDFRYTVQSGEHSHTQTQTCVAFHAVGQDLPRFVLKPENMGHRFLSLFGYQDINFDSHPAFSKAYLLRGPDEAAIRELFTPLRLEFFEAERGFTVAGGGDRLAVFRAGKKVAPKDVRDFLAAAFRVYGTMCGGGETGQMAK